MAPPPGYSTYATVHLERDDGILLVRMHTDNGPLIFSMDAHAEWVRLWGEIIDDAEARLVIITGTGDAFMPPRVMPGGGDRSKIMTPLYWQRIMRECTDHVMKLLSIPSL
jgi:hypothetical protein